MISEKDVKSVDKGELLNQLKDLPKQVEAAYNLMTEINFEKPVKNILICGMGGSGIPGMLLKAYLKDCKIPVTVVSGYDVPAWIDENTLVFTNSYSGNTEETLSAYRGAFKKTTMIVSVTSGGKLEEISRMNRTPVILIPKGMQPRTAIAYLFFPMLRVLEHLRIIKKQTEHVKHLIASLRKQDVDDAAKNLSEHLFGKIPIIYASDDFYPVAYRWKTQLNEHAKVMAFSHWFSEMNHNEIVGYTNLKGNFYVIMLRNDTDHRRIQKRMQLCRTLIQDKGVNVTDLAIKGQDLLTKIFSAIHIGDLVAFYLAIQYQIDPSPVEIVEKLKKDLGTFLI